MRAGDAWFTRAVAWAKQWARSGEPFDPGKVLSDAIHDIKIPSFLDRQFARFHIDAWKLRALDLITWLATYSDGKRLLLDRDVARRIRRDNSFLAPELAVGCERFADSLRGLRNRFSRKEFRYFAAVLRGES